MRGMCREQYRLFWNSCKVVSIKLLLAFVIIALSTARFRQPPFPLLLSPLSMPLTVYLLLPLFPSQFPLSFSRCSLISIWLTSVFAGKMMNCSNSARLTSDNWSTEGLPDKQTDTQTYKQISNNKNNNETRRTQSQNQKPKINTQRNEMIF